MSDSKAKWREQIKEFPVKGCGRLDMATYLPVEATVGRVTSDRVRYVYMEDGSEVICLGKLCDHVAFRAAEHDVVAAALDAKDERIKELERAARGGNAINDTATMLRGLADRLVTAHVERRQAEIIRCAYERAAMLDAALQPAAREGGE